MKRRASSKQRDPSANKNWPTWAVALLYALLPFVISVAGLEKFRAPKQIVFIAFAGFLLAGFLATRRLDFRRLQNRWNLLLLLVLSYVMLHVIFLGRGQVSWIALLNILALSIVLLVLVEFLQGKSQKDIWMAAGLGIAINALLTILQYSGLFPLLERLSGEELAGRLIPAGLIGEVNSGGFLFALMSIIALAGFFSETTAWRRGIWVVIFSTCLLGLIFTRTLTAVVGLVVCLAFWIFWQHWRILFKREGSPRWLLGFWGFLLIGGLVAFVAASRAGLTGRITTVIEQIGQGDLNSATAGRQPVFVLTWQMIKEQPFWGRGLNSFGQDFFSYRADTEAGQSIQLLTQPGAFRQTHNEYLQLWEETGLLGLLGWLALMGGLLWQALRAALHSKDQASAFWRFHIFLGLVLVCVTSLTFFPFHVGITAAFAVLLAASVRSDVERQQDSSPAWLNWQEKVPRPAFTAIALVWALFAAWNAIGDWQANVETGHAAEILEAARSQPTGRRRSVLVRQALSLLDRAQQESPTLFEIENLKGTANFLLGKYDLSVKHYRLAAHYLPSPEIYTNLAAALMSVREDREARELLEKALRYNPKYVPARQALETLREGS